MLFWPSWQVFPDPDQNIMSNPRINSNDLKFGQFIFYRQNSYLKVCLEVRDYKTKSSENKVIRQQFKKCTECKGTAKNLQVKSQERKKTLVAKQNK